MLHRQTAVIFYRTSAVEYLLVQETKTNPNG